MNRLTHALAASLAVFSTAIFLTAPRRTIIPTIRSRLYVTCFFRGEDGQEESRGGQWYRRGMRNMAARAKRLHLFIVSARGRRQNVHCARARICICIWICVYMCACAKLRKNKGRERERETKWEKRRNRMDEGTQGEREMGKREELCGGGSCNHLLTGWLVTEQSSCTLILLVVQQ